jgi:hypothetical protein
MKKIIFTFTAALLLYSCDTVPDGDNTNNNTNTGVENLQMGKDSTLKQVRPGH